MTNVISHEAFLLARHEKNKQEIIEKSQYVLDLLTSGPEFVALAQEQTFFALLAEIADHQGHLNDMWLNVLTTEMKSAESHPSIAPFGFTMEFRSRLGKWLNKAEEETPFIEVRSLVGDDGYQAADPAKGALNAEQLNGIRARYLEKTGKVVWSFGVMFFTAWQYLLENCQIQILEETETRVTLRARDLDFMDTVEVVFHLDAPLIDTAYINAIIAEDKA
jgi:hypothetical protein